MRDNRKRGLSIRLGEADIRRMKILAERLGVKDSDVLRYALKMLLQRLAPLCDPSIRGAALIPVLVDNAVDLLPYFECDAKQLDAIINTGVDPEHRVSSEDISLLTMAGARPSYGTLSPSISRGAGGSVSSPALTSESISHHLYGKYLFGKTNEGASADSTTIARDK